MLKKALKLTAFAVFSSIIISCSKEEINEEIITNDQLESEIFSAVSKNEKRSVTLKWNGKPWTLAASFQNAVRQAGTGGTVWIPKGTYRTDRPIVLPNISVTIAGAGRDQVRVEATKRFNASGLIITGANNTQFKNFTVNWKGLNWISAAITSNGKNGVKAIGMRFANAGYGFGTPDDGKGKSINFLLVRNCQFNNCRRGIAFIRYFNENPISWIGKVIIENCQFFGNQIVGVSIDAGNDGSDGRPNLKFKPKAKQAKKVVLDMNGMTIRGCNFGKASNFNIAIAKCKNINIFGNTLEGTNGSVINSEAINVEHESHNINISGNTIKNFSSKGTHTFISLVSFRDYGNKPLFENGVRAINIRNNSFIGNCRFGITGEETTSVTIANNTFRIPQPREKYINLFKSQRGNRWFSQSGNKFITKRKVKGKDKFFTNNVPNFRIAIVPFK